MRPSVSILAGAQTIPGHRKCKYSSKYMNKIDKKTKRTFTNSNGCRLSNARLFQLSGKLDEGSATMWFLVDIFADFFLLSFFSAAQPQRNTMDGWVVMHGREIPCRLPADPGQIILFYAAV